jgi:hypothetical protein
MKDREKNKEKTSGPGNSDSLARSQPFRAPSKVQNCSYPVAERHITQLGRFEVP